jgi:hypothetical protein
MCVTILCVWSPPVCRQVSAPFRRTSGLNKDNIVMHTAALSNKIAVCITTLSVWSLDILRCGTENCLRTGGLQRHKIVTRMRPCPSCNVAIHRHQSCLARPLSHRDLITSEPGGSRTMSNSKPQAPGLQSGDIVRPHVRHDFVPLEPAGLQTSFRSIPQNLWTPQR